MLIVIYNVV